MRRWLQPLRNTVLHPQWFALRDERQVRRWVKANANGRVLDIGCADEWARQVISAQCEYIGLDYPLTAQGAYGTRPDVFADGGLLPFRDGTFDTVLLLEVLEHVAEPARVLSEIERVLKSGGVLLLSMPFLYPLHDAPHDYQRYTAPGLKYAVVRAGLDCIEPLPRNTGFRTAALLLAIACADCVLSATRTRHWRLAFAPFLMVCIPIINGLGWLLGWLGDSGMIASGHSIEARKP
ncbi:MAG: class I SAM-dependent methyltransferase [Rudaea sp.]|uniref:class I SAM-dependent methyltransferase n=1 Tax=Rudaea sp. TaxID=2136325 RepID=UPI0039E3E630